MSGFAVKTIKVRVSDHNMFIDPPPQKPRSMPIRSSVEIASGNSILSWFVKKAQAVKDAVKSVVNK